MQFSLILITFLLSLTYAIIPNCFQYSLITSQCEVCENGYIYDKFKNECQQKWDINSRDTINVNSNEENTLIQNQSDETKEKLPEKLASKNTPISLNQKQRILIETSISLKCLVLDPADQRKCLICQDRYYPQNGICKQVAKNCIEYNRQTGRCYTCSQNYKLQLNQCIDVNCLSFDSSSLVIKCVKCLSNYTLNSQTNQCQLIQLKPLQNNCILVQNGICTKCLDGYYLNQQNNNSCNKIPLNCLYFQISSGRCVQCMQNYALSSNNSCIDVEGSGNVDGNVDVSGNADINAGININPNPNPISNNINQTISNPSTTPFPTPDPNCKIYHQNNTCKQCQNRYYLSQNSLTCLNVNIYCKNYNKVGGKCLQCYQGYTLKINLNYSSCWVSTISNCKVENNLTIKVSPSASPSLATTSTTSTPTYTITCVQCYNGYFLNSSTHLCQLANTLCRTYSQNDGHCLSCYPGYKLFGSECKMFIEDPNCKAWNNLTSKCQQCYQRYYFKEQSQTCTLISPYCKQYNRFNGYCTDCYKGYNLTLNGSCKVYNSSVNINNLLKNCKAQLNNVCLVCSDSFYFNINQQCVERNPLCKTFQVSNGFCTSCYSGYILRNSLCLIPSMLTDGSFDQNCQKMINLTHCSSCYEGYFIKSGRCQKLNPLCRTSNPAIGACLTCFSGYSLQNSSCELIKKTSSSSTNKSENCLKYKVGVCIQCSQSYYLNQNNQCIQYDPLCKSTNISNGNCISCYDGYYLTTKSKCQIFNTILIPYCQQINLVTSTCQKCMFGYYLSPSITQCRYLSLLCTKYRMDTGQCSQCLNGYFLQDNQCIYPAIGMDINCVRYEGAFCSKCRNGYGLLNYRCIQVINA